MKQEWQPIETAPKDHDILLFSENRISQGYWDNKSGAFEITTDFLACQEDYFDIKPTHWMPLPKPPTE